MGVPAYLPLKKHINIQPVISKGKNYCYQRILHVPMFANYLFADITPDLQYELYRDRSVIRVLSVTKSEEDHLLRELNLIRELEIFSESEGIDVLDGLQAGRRVLFTGGPLAGWNGVVSALAQEGMVYVNIVSIQASVRVKYHAAWCSLCEEAEERGTQIADMDARIAAGPPAERRQT